ncbi:hypothetical protein N825_34260 [Skermanella stibiiresistens SB22]|uniref:histidine kinase n=1 Tax=Skermanella stibiiresistens SB22 TaxID=1385369 RepID=W9GTP1_9PROT|nr:CHASE domain-containing protein [Skermanella stibiiresistens]EWY35802.1 hypothetical protein N825_34260 [Skermanella stibiiresistens SB22]
MGLLATAGAMMGFWLVMERRDHERFLQEVGQAETTISNRMETYVAVLRATSALFASSEAVTRAEFAAFVVRLNLRGRYAGIRSIGFSARVASDQVGRLEAEMRGDGVEGFHIWPQDRRDEFNSVIYLEPLDDQNRVAIGFDMSVDPVRRNAMERARDTGEPAASGKVRLVREADGRDQAGFLIYMPVYQGSAIPTTVEERRDLLSGHAYAAFQADELFERILWGARPNLALEVHDGEPGKGALMHRSSDWSVGGTPRYGTERPLAVAGRVWTVSYAASAGLEAASGRGLVWIVGIGGLLATSLLSAAAVGQSRARADAERASRAERLRARELETINGVGIEVSAQLDLDRLVQSITDAATQVSGAQIGAFLYNVLDERGESYTLHALSGEKAGAFANLSMPRNTAVFGPTFRGEGAVRSDDITRDARYGHNAPHHGVPRGHPAVRSYLGVPVVSRSGETLGGLLLGHGEAGVFTAAAERLVVGLAAQAAVAVDNARLFGAALREAEQRKLLLDELNHRVKNTLAAVQSIARETSRSSPTPATFLASFEGRLLALSNTHDLITRGNWKNAPLMELARAELAPHGHDRALIAGPDVWLPPQDAVALGMAFHELATNAAKHGALSVPGGRVRIGWRVVSVDGGSHLRVEWEEFGGPPVAPPERHGFGTRLLRGVLASQLDGVVSLDFAPEGVRCVVEFPLRDGKAV